VLAGALVGALLLLLIQAHTSPVDAAVVTATATTGNLRVYIVPTAAIPDGARWRVDGGTWKRSGATVTGLTPGTHTVSFRVATGWTRPTAKKVTITAGKTSGTIGTYVLSSGSVVMLLEPQPAITEGAQWALDGGAWQNAGATIKRVAPGLHTVTFRGVTGWYTPVEIPLQVNVGQTSLETGTYTLTLGQYVVLGFNDLGMHCMNQDFSEFMILPPYNTVHAQVIRRGKEPKIIKSGVTVNYSIPGNTTSSNKTNFWDYAFDLFGVNLPPDVGLSGNGLSGRLTRDEEQGDWYVTGIPVTPINDAGKLDPYPLAKLTVTQNGTQIARTNTVVPVSWEISCELCHTSPDVSVGTDILRKHDVMHGTTLENQKPVVCGECHAQAPLGLSGKPGVPSLSRAMHNSHATRIAEINLDNGCYACHPGFETSCQRDVHFSKGMDCVACHGEMQAVASPSRRPWVDEPKCGDCHQRKEFRFEEEGKLFRESRGHQEIECAVCHGSPHAITPTVTEADNAQAIMHQGTPGVLDCVVCHITKPNDEFEHHM
jgi:hypothetical protein